MSLPPGTRLGPYEIVAAIGAGGMGEVYRARDQRLNREVALKVLPASLSADTDRLRRFALEAQTAGSLNHPNVLTIYEVGTDGGHPYLAAELLSGETLREKLNAGAIPVSKALDYGRQTATGLAAAHARQITHRDIKPENLFVTTDGRVKILDFGLARQSGTAPDASDDTRLHTGTSPGVVLGTVGYMSPEQVRAQPVDHRSDLFSLGVVLYEMLSGTRPFAGDSAVETMNAILTKDAPELTSSVRALPPALVEVVRHALEKQPDERFQSARDMAFALQSASGTSSGSTATPAVAASSRRARRILPFASAVAMGALFGGLAMWLARPPASRQVDLQARRFTPIATDAAVESRPAWSPDGRTLAYFTSGHRSTASAAATTVGTPSSLVIKDLEAPAPVTLVQNAERVRDIFWWPDSTRVGYADDHGIWAVSRAGGDPERLHAGRFLAATLSPDGRTLACWQVVTDGTARTAGLWVASPANTALVKYERGFDGAEAFTPVYMRFAPDGSRLLLSGYLPDPSNRRDYSPGVWEITGATLDTMGPPRRVFASRTWPVPPDVAWLPDGRRVTLALGIAPGLWLGDTSDGTLAKMTDGLAGEMEPAVSPDGRRIAFEVRRDDFDMVEIPLDGSPIVDVVAASLDESGGSATPDGRVLYVSTQSGSDEIRLRSPDGTDRAVVTGRDFPGEPVGRLLAPVVSPDGRRVLFQRLLSDVAEAWIAPLSGGAPVRAVPTAELTWMPDWSPDGRWIALVTSAAGAARIIKQRVGSSEPPQVLVDAIANAYGHLLAWSPDGTWIAHDSPDGLSLVAAEGGSRRLLVNGTRPRAIAWSSDSRTIYALVMDAKGGRVIAVTVGSGAVRVVRPLPAELEFGTSVNPGLRMTLTGAGTRLLTTALRTRSDIWMMEGFE
jgi:serine/threonine protein kinase/Tol biopolymer transport system component